MLSKFFLHRPVFAWVVAIAMMLGGVLAIYNLPISQYPPIAPPSISVRAVYPGATAKTVEDSVVQIIEQKMTGLDRMLYLSATSDSSGSGALELTFAPGVDPDLAWSKVQNKLHVVENGVDATAFLRREGRFADAPRPGLILLDLNLPKKSGREVLKEIKTHPDLKSIPVVVLSTSRADEDVVHSYGLHANCYITKPVEFHKFAEVVRSIREFWFSVVTLPPRPA